ncbi:hypothetical protein [Flavobacterium sp.]|uniref:hypothetical protein n=1 Tax=Flavobacterium sp. TaxID=239 RepID=UPI002B7A7948|nr:hypothetical protein [Flavobacterium sp.]HSD05713.1 hypothetical protein [Flavobacterium sp.]
MGTITNENFDHEDQNLQLTEMSGIEQNDNNPFYNSQDDDSSYVNEYLNEKAENSNDPEHDPAKGNDETIVNKGEDDDFLNSDSDQYHDDDLDYDDDTEDDFDDDLIEKYNENDYDINDREPTNLNSDEDFQQDLDENDPLYNLKKI